MNSAKMDESLVRKVLAEGMKKGGEFCELYYEHRKQNSISLEENKIKDSRTHISEGVGIRVIKGEKIGYAYSDILDEEPLLKAAQTAAYIAGNKDTGPVSVTEGASPESHAFEYEDPALTPAKAKAGMLHKANDAARSFDDAVYQVNCVYFDESKYIEIANSEGLRKNDTQSVMNMTVAGFARNSEIMDVGRAFGGGRYPMSLFEEITPESLGKEAARQAVSKLSAKPAPAGTFPVVIAKGWGGVLVHEAVGHGLESDFHRKKTSLYTGREGEKVASDLVTIIDDGTIPNGRGTIAIDDEGTPGRKNVLIKDGILTGLMSDRLNAGLMGLEPTGNGRRMSFREYPLPRMTNTFIDVGSSKESDLIKDIKYGVYAAQLGGGQVDITTGNYVFEISVGYLIEDGKLTNTIRGANLIGNGPQSMGFVVGIGDQLSVESGTGTCGKDGQSVYVGVGQPAIYISEMTVGGTGA